MKQKQVKQWAFFGLGFAASLLAILGLAFRILLPFTVLIAAAIYITVATVDINLLIDHYSSD